jgi:hypothetical protein
VQARQQTSLGGAFALAAIGGVACGLLALLGLLALSGVASAALLVWLARRVVDVAPSQAPQRPGPMGWSSYDRRRSGRARLEPRAWRRLLGRRRRPTADAGPPPARRPVPRPAPLPPSPPGEPGRRRERDAR